MFCPEELTSTEPLLWSPGRGTEVWELFNACAAGDLATVDRLVTANPSLVRAHHEYRTPLYFAVRENRMPVAQLLVDRGANPFYNGDDLVEMARLRGLGPMEAFLERRRPAGRFVSTVQYLVQAMRIGGDLARETVNRMMARPSSCDIWTASWLGLVDRVRELLDVDPSLVNRAPDDRSGTPLVHASGRGHLEVVRLLLERGADPNVPEEGNAPHGRALYSAVYHGHYEVARLLLDHGAHPNQEVESSADAPTIAVMNSDTRMLALLASHGGIWDIPVQVAAS